MLKPSDEQINKACRIAANEMPFSDLYHIVIKPLPVAQEIDAVMNDKFPTLAGAGVVARSTTQVEREERGQHIGLLCHVGEGAFKGSLVCDNPPRSGDVVIFNKYAGLRQEFPPGSGDMYIFCNDEDIVGRYKTNVLGE